MGLRGAMAIEQLQPAAWAEPHPLVLSVGDAELALRNGAKLHMVDPAIEEARRGGGADQIGEGDAVVAGAGERRGAITAFAGGAPHLDVREQRMPEIEALARPRGFGRHAHEARPVPVRPALLVHRSSPRRSQGRKPNAVLPSVNRI